MRTYCYLIFVFLLLPPLVCAVDNFQQARDLIERASAQTNIFELPSFAMRADVHLDNFGKPVNGTYSLIWNGPEQWREEISLPGYNEAQIGGKGVISRNRTTDYMPYQVFQLHRALGFGTDGVSNGFFNLRPLENEMVKKIHDEKIAGAKSTCVEIVTDATKHTREVCIDQTTSRINRRKSGPIDTDWIAVGGKFFPKSIVLHEEGKSLVELHITDLNTGGAIQSGLFEHAAGVTQRAGCMNPVPAHKISNVVPHYPEQDRLNRRQGTVGLYTIINVAGIPQDLRIALGASAGLNVASIDAVRQWRYAPATCDGKPVETESIIEVHYTLSSL